MQEAASEVSCVTFRLEMNIPYGWSDHTRTSLCTSVNRSKRAMWYDYSDRPRRPFSHRDARGHVSRRSTNASWHINRVTSVSECFTRDQFSNRRPRRRVYSLLILDWTIAKCSGLYIHKRSHSFINKRSDLNSWRSVISVWKFVFLFKKAFSLMAPLVKYCASTQLYNMVQKVYFLKP